MRSFPAVRSMLPAARFAQHRSSDGLRAPASAIDDAQSATKAGSGSGPGPAAGSGMAQLDAPAVADGHVVPPLPALRPLYGLAVTGVIAFHTHLLVGMHSILLIFILVSFASARSCAMRRSEPVLLGIRSYYVCNLCRGAPPFYVAIAVYWLLFRLGLAGASSQQAPALPRAYLFEMVCFLNGPWSGPHSFMHVEWSISVLAGFHLVCPLLMLVVKRLDGALIFTFLATVQAAILNRVQLPWDTTLSLPSLLPAFALGTVAAHVPVGVLSDAQRRERPALSVACLFITAYCLMVVPNDADLVLVRAALWLPFIASLHFSACPLLENSLFDTIGQYWFHVSAVPTPACQPCLHLYRFGRRYIYIIRFFRTISFPECSAVFFRPLSSQTRMLHRHWRSRSGFC